MGRRVFAYTDAEEYGGAERALSILLTGLSASGWRPVLLHRNTPGLQPLLESIAPFGIPTMRVPAMPEGAGGAAAAARMAMMLRRERPDVFHAQMAWPMACKWGLVAACAARVPAVVGMVQLYVEVPVTLGRRLQVRALATRVGRMIGVSQHTTDRLENALGWPRNRLTVVRNAVDVDRFARARPDGARSEIDDGSGRPIALVVGRLDHQKGHVHLVEAARRLPGVRFVCVGDGPLRDQIKGWIATAGVADRITLLGYRSDVDRLLAASDLVVLPSLYEGLPLSLIEAMAAGRPLVTTDIGGTRELVTHNVTGILVRPADPVALADGVARLVSSPELARRLANAARALALESYSAEAMVSGVANEYRRLLTGAP